MIKAMQLLQHTAMSLLCTGPCCPAEQAAAVALSAQQLVQETKPAGRTVSPLVLLAQPCLITLQRWLLLQRGVLRSYC
jgi:hypothetical protein